MLNGAAAPLIGISAYPEEARWGVWRTRAMLVPGRYVDAVTAAGAIPVLLPPVPGIEDTLSRLDGLLLSGGADIDPARYGAEPAPQTVLVPRERDSAEFAMFAAARSLQLPVLGICRGMQVINVAQGGSLHQHLPDVVGHQGHAPVPGAFGTHAVRVAPASRLAAILGAGDGCLSIATPTHHHQAVSQLGKGLTATAWAADGTVEAFEFGQAGSFVVGVQWHPEAGDDPRLFRALVTAARDHAASPLAT